MSLRGLFCQGTCWVHIPLYFLHFPSRPFNLLIFSMKVLKLFWEKTSWKWKVLCIWLKIKLAKQIFLLLKSSVKNTTPTSLTWLFFSIFIKKTLENFLLGIWNEGCCNLFYSFDIFSQCQKSFSYLLFLFIAYFALVLNKIKN